MSSPYYTVTDPAYVPQMENIASITLGYPTIVETTEDNGYLDGCIIRLVIPPAWGIPQINGQYAPITVISSTEFSMDIDSTFFDPLVAPSSPVQVPQTIPIGEIAGTLASSNFNRQGDAPLP